MKKMLCLAVVATAFISAPALAGGGGGGKGLNVGANVLTGKGGVLGAVLGKGGALGGLLGGGCGCGH